MRRRDLPSIRRQSDTHPSWYCRSDGTWSIDGNALYGLALGSFPRGRLGAVDVILNLIEAVCNTDDVKFRWPEAGLAFAVTVNRSPCPFAVSGMILQVFYRLQSVRRAFARAKPDAAVLISAHDAVNHAIRPSLAYPRSYR